ncbi:MAG: hypothetical protein JOZ58_26745 [Acetobacteraceae bacterium]|nr:hypothetical protein [Acetobacteraceae bacterium]
MLAGTLAAPAIIRRGGHIRAFAAFVALATPALHRSSTARSAFLIGRRRLRPTGCAASA